MADSRGPLVGAGARVRVAAPPPALCGFLLLLALIFAGAYAVGAALDPVAPGIYNTDTGEAPAEENGGGGDMGGMGGMGGGGR